MNNKFIDNINIILKYANKSCPQKYNSKYNNEYYLKHIIHVLKDVSSWKSLQNVIFNETSNTHNRICFIKFIEFR